MLWHLCTCSPQVSHVEPTSKIPCPPSKLNIKPSTQPVSNRHRNIFQASDLIAGNSSITENIVLEEHFSKQHVKDARSLFKKMLNRSSIIIERSQNKHKEPPLVKPNSNTVEAFADLTSDSTSDSTVSGMKNKPLYIVGQQVLCNFCNHGQWCPGSITSSTSGSDSGHRYHIHYDDGDTEEDREEAAIMEVPDESRSIIHFPYQVGDLVLGNYEEKGIWFEGRLSSFEADGEDILFDIEYLDGDVDYSIPASCIIHAKKAE